MRVVGGKLRSRKIVTPKNKDDVRPTSDRTRETIFNILSNVTGFENTNIIDLFAGTGALGIEALSRGAGHCIFVDKDVTTVIKNVNLFELESFSVVVKKDSLSYLRNKSGIDMKADIVFADPPYKFNDYKLLVTLVSETGCIFVLEHGNEIDFPDEVSGNIIKARKSGRAFLTIFDFRK